MAKGPADQTAKCGPHNRRPVGHASQHRVGACEGSHAAGLGKIEAICSHPQAGWCVPQWGPSPCGEGRQSSSTRIVQNERKSQTCRQYSMQTQGVPNSPFQGGRTVRCARSVRKVGCFPPLVATDPKVQNSAPYPPPCWYTRDYFFLSLMLATGPRVLNAAPPMLF